MAIATIDIFEFEFMWTGTGKFMTLAENRVSGIKPGSKPKKENGEDDKRRRVNPLNKPKHPGLKPHKHKPKD